MVFLWFSSFFSETSMKPGQLAEVIGLLQRILEDVHLELKEAETAEGTAEAEYQGFLKDPGGWDPLGGPRMGRNSSETFEKDLN